MKEEQATIVVQVQPNASQNKVVRFANDIWYLRIVAPPVKGKANQELNKFLSDILGINKSNLTIVKGMTSKRKLVAIKGLLQDQVTSQLKKLSM